VAGQVMDGVSSSHGWKFPEPNGGSWENHRTKWGIFKCHVFDYRMVLLKILKVGDMTDMIHPVIMVIFFGFDPSQFSGERRERC